MIVRHIEERDYDKILELDKKVYPTDSPVDSSVLNAWYQRNPEFGIVFEENRTLKGLCIAIPLNKYGWEKLISGELAESELGSDTIFDNDRDNEIGIHVYHIEKFGFFGKFHELSFEALSNIVSSLRNRNPGLNVIGISALCVTLAGIMLFHDRLKFRERDFISTEYILKKNGKIKIFDSGSEEDVRKKQDHGYEYVTRCKMLVSFPNEASIVWNFMK